MILTKSVPQAQPRSLPLTGSSSVTDRTRPPPNQGWQSDVIADLIRQFGFAYITLNPGASYRGLHDSLVNHNHNDPPMLLCQHEKIAVQIAHGYAKACGEPLCVIVHNVVGLLHATMGIYYAYTDRAPVFVVGATGPMDEGKRRPRVDWDHTAMCRATWFATT
jgi:acetolactate synthase-1/2/3 large subunit